MSGYNFEFKGLGGARCIATRLTCYLTAAHAKVARERGRRAGREFGNGSFACWRCGTHHNMPPGYVPEPAPQPEPEIPEWPTVGAGRTGTICVDTGKLCFDGEEAATAERKRKRRQGYVERSIGSYHCRFCDLWHNTSQEPRH